MPTQDSSRNSVLVEYTLDHLEKTGVITFAAIFISVLFVEIWRHIWETDSS